MGVFSLPDGVTSADRVVYVGIQILMIVLVKRNLQQIIMVNYNVTSKLPTVNLSLDSDLASAWEESSLLCLFEFTLYLVLFRTKIFKIRQEKARLTVGIY